MVQTVAKYGKCPYPGCSQQIDKRSDKIIIFEKMLAKMFKEYETSYNDVVDSKDSNSDCSTTYINITGLTGESMQIPYTLKLTVMELKNYIQRELRIDTSKQKLLYEDKEIEVSCLFSNIYITYISTSTVQLFQLKARNFGE